jgi:succinyl-diaminopimelate desuccinylase
LYGRGAADMKGSLAAMVVAAERFVAAHPAHRGRIGFILTSDEEGPAVAGTAHVVRHLERAGIGLDWCLIGEPSSQLRLGDTVRVGRRGSLTGALTVHGVQGHVAYPERADNPIHRALPALLELAATRWDDGDAPFPPTSFQISNLVAGTGADNVIPGTLSARFNFRYSTAQTQAALERTVADVLARHGLRHSLTWHAAGAPFLSRAGRLLETTVGVVEELCGLTPERSTGGGTSDGRFIAPLGCELLELGPVNATIHQIDECVALDELDRLADVYALILERMLAD